MKLVIGNDPDKGGMKGVEQRLDTVIELLTRITFQLTEVHEQGEQQMADLAALQAEVEQNGDVGQSAIALLNGLSQQLRDAVASNDPAAIAALADQLDAQSTALADAVTANTPAAGGENPEDVPHPDQTLPGDLPAQ